MIDRYREGSRVAAPRLLDAATLWVALREIGPPDQLSQTLGQRVQTHLSGLFLPWIAPCPPANKKRLWLENMFYNTHMLSDRQLAHVLIPNLPVQVERPRLGPGPLLIVSTLEAGTLLACSSEARALGLGPGSSRYAAQQLLPDALCAEADEHAYHALHAAVQAALQTFTPEVETIGLGEWVVDLRGIRARAESGERQSGERGTKNERRGAKSEERVEEVSANVQADSPKRSRSPRKPRKESGEKTPAEERLDSSQTTTSGNTRSTYSQAPLFERAVTTQPRLVMDIPSKPAPTTAVPLHKIQPTQETLRQIAQELARAVQSASGLQVQIGVAANRFTAEQAAKSVERGAKNVASRSTLHAPRSTLLIPAGEEARFLAPLPIDTLPHLPGEIRRRLHLLDLHTLGDLAALRKPAVLSQFGSEFAGLYELACGRDPRPVRVDVPPLRVVRSLLLPELVDRGLILNALGRLSRQVGRALQRSGHHAEALRLTLALDDGRRLEIGAAVKPPSSDETRLMRLAAQLLGRLDVPAPVVSAAVSVYPLRSWHLGYYQRALREANVIDEKQGRLEEALHAVARRFGDAAVRVAAFFGPPLPLPITIDLNADGQPLHFCLGGRGYAVLAVEETWREERRWWDRPIRRDYFRVQVGDGSPRTLYQDLDRLTWHLDRAWPR